MASGDVPVISQPTDSTRIDIKPPAAAAKPAAAPAARPTTVATKPPVASPPPDPRKSSELRRTGTQPVQAVQAPKPAAAPPPPAAARDDEDPEKLLREYAERQKTKVTRLEGELVELRKAAAEKEQFRLKSEAQAKDIADLRAKLEAASKLDGIIRDLQGKLDAAILSNGMLGDENGKLKARGQELAAAVKKTEERAAHAEKGLADASRALAAEREARKDAEARIAAASQALRPAAAPQVRK